MVTAAAGFASALGYFNPLIILILSILGDLVPDAIYYWFGYVSRLTFIKKIVEKFWLSEIRMLKTENLLKKHYGKSMVIFKLTPGISVPAFILVGYLKLSFKKFMALCSAVTFPKAIIFLIIGYYFGQAYNVSKYLHDAALLFPLAIIIIILIYFGYNKVLSMLAKKIEKS